MEGFLFRGWKPIFSGVRWLYVRSPANQRLTSSIYDPQSISDCTLGLGFPHRAGSVRTGGSPFSSPGCRSCTYMEGFLIRGWDHVHGWREPQPVSIRPAGFGFPHPAGWFRPGGSPFSSPGCRSCTYMVGFLIRGWDHVVHGSREPQPVSNRPAGFGFPHPAGRFRPGGSPFLFPGCRSCTDMEEFLIRG